MTALALVLVLASALFHATWNLLAKRAGGGAAFVWLSDVLALAVFLPLFVWALVTSDTPIGPTQLLFIAGSGALHVTYFLTLLRGYRAGDLSLVYPLARGTGPVISTIGAILLFAERPSALALGGMALIALGAFFLTGGPRALGARNAGTAAAYGLVTGLLIGAYTLWDKGGLTVGMLPPLVLYYGGTFVRVAILTPAMRARASHVQAEWREHKVELFGVAVLGTLSYLLVLTALGFSPVSYVAPAREISILLGAVMGTRLLAEGDALRRILASVAMVLGVVALAVG
ncbi:MAG TPA: DMT family transporter [Chloroflexia bacterium]|nr:DMT family transporter [Chloroflexia bacterium]